MEYLQYILKFFYRIRWWLLTLPIIVAMVTYYFASKRALEYDVKTTVYTGLITGYNIESGNTVTIDQSNNNMANLLNIITSERTLKLVSIRLYAECMIHGNPNEDNNYITAKSYRELLDITPKEVQALIDKKSEEKTIKNLLDYERPNSKNFIYGLLNYFHPYFSITSLTEKIKVERMGASDIIEIRYSANDPGIAYNTLVILNKEFIEQYQELRFGETRDVIKFFEAELLKLGKQLKHAEDSLTNYNIEKRIINYPEQTKQVTILDAGYQIKMQQLLLDYTSTKSLADFFETKLGDQAQRLRSNSSFISQLNKISSLNSQLANAEIYNTENTEQVSKQIKEYKQQLQNAEKEFTSISEDLTSHQNSTSNISSKDLIAQWLEQIVLAEKTKAEMDAMKVERNKLNKDFVYYSPVGSTLKRQERNIGFIESTYMSMLSSLNAARLRQKNLQMTSATLRIMTPPMFPLSAQPSKARTIALSAFLITIIFITGYFLFVEIFDRTLRNKLRAERITGGVILGAFPGESILRYRRYNKAINLIATKYLSNAILPYCQNSTQNIINLLSTEPKAGKSHIADQLVEYWTSLGIKVRKVTYDIDFQADSKQYLLAKNIDELCSGLAQEDILIIEYPSLKEYSISPSLLKEATVNLLIAKAGKVWKNTDQMIYDQIIKITEKETPVFIYLNNASRDAVEDFTGQLPPYTKLKNMLYRFSQFGFTSE